MFKAHSAVHHSVGVAIGFGSPSGCAGVTRLNLNDILAREAEGFQIWGVVIQAIKFMPV